MYKFFFIIYISFQSPTNNGYSLTNYRCMNKDKETDIAFIEKKFIGTYKWKYSSVKIDSIVEVDRETCERASELRKVYAKSFNN